MEPNLDGCFNNNIKIIRIVPLWQRLRTHIKLGRNYPSKFKNIHKQFPLNGQGISGCRWERRSRRETYGPFVFNWCGNHVPAGTLDGGYIIQK
jgi:hypothetical protein